MIRTTIANVAKAIKNKQNDDDINSVIQKHINDFKLSISIEQWKVNNYSDLRRWAYPSFEEYLDAMVKISAGGETKTEGESQLNDYYTKCISVKERFPKVQVEPINERE